MRVNNLIGGTKGTAFTFFAFFNYLVFCNLQPLRVTCNLKTVMNVDGWESINKPA